MIFRETGLAGVWIIEPEPKEDERGSFARIFCAREFAARGLETGFVQCSTSFNRRRGTLRGLHFQAPPHEEAKLVRCTSGTIYDVIVDLRPGSATYCRWAGQELSAENRHMMYVPKGFAHGFLTIEDGCEVFYQMTEYYRPEAARGVRWDDPAFGIEWPFQPACLSERDRRYPPVQ